MARSLPEAEFFLPASVRAARKRRDVVARARQGKVVHLSHGECLDGAGSDVIVRLKHGDAEVSTIYSDPALVVEKLDWVASAGIGGEGRSLLLSDVSPQGDQRARLEAALGSLNELGWRIEWRDHHAKQWQGGMLEAVKRKADHMRVDLDNHECGTSICQQELLPNDAFAKELAHVVRDIDLWLRKDPRSLALTDARHGMGSRAFVAAMLRARQVVPPEVEAAGKAWRAQFERELGEAIRGARIVQGRNKVGVVYGDFPGSLICDALRQARGTDAEVALKPSGKFSLRTRQELPFAQSVASRFHGGGHPNASGGQLHLSPWEWPRYWLARGRCREAQALVKAASEGA